MSSLLRLDYLPIVDAVTRTPVALQARVRDSHFVTGPDLERWMVALAGIESAQLRATGLDLPVVVDVSQSALTPGEAQPFCTWFCDAALDPGQLILEVKEGEGRADECAADFGRACRARGMRIAVGDFGCGASSLALLQSLAVDLVRIDARFVRALPDDAAAASIVRTLIALARDLNVLVVADDVSEHAQSAWLTRAGCDYLQGPVIWPPLHLDALTALKGSLA